MNHQRPGFRMARLILLAIASLAFSFVIMTNELFAEVTNSLLNGWLRFIVRVFPNITIRWDGIAFIIVALTITIVIAHSFLKWLFQFNVSQTQAEAGISWRWRSTVAIMSLILSLFAIGISFSGIVHQTGWVMRSPEPWYAAEQVQSASDQKLSGYNPNLVAEGGQMNWAESILVFLPRFVDGADRKKGWNDPVNADRYKKVVPELLNPSLAGPIKSPDGYGLSHFAGNHKVFRSDRKLKFADFENPLDQTIMFGECNAGFMPWPSLGNVRDVKLGIRDDWSQSQPGRIGFGPIRSHSTMMTLMADGSVRGLDKNIDPSVLSKMSSPLLDDAP